MNKAWDTLAASAAAIVAVTLIAVLVSKNANTPAVFASAGDAFAGVLRAATAPVLN